MKEKDKKKKNLLANANEQAVLAGYFASKSCAPDAFQTSQEELKTTLQIQEDLRPILNIEGEIIVDYIRQATDVKLVLDEDGNLAWRLFKKI